MEDRLLPKQIHEFNEDNTQPYKPEGYEGNYLIVSRKHLGRKQKEIQAKKSTNTNPTEWDMLYANELFTQDQIIAPGASTIEDEVIPFYPDYYRDYSGEKDPGGSPKEKISGIQQKIRAKFTRAIPGYSIDETRKAVITAYSQELTGFFTSIFKNYLQESEEKIIPLDAKIQNFQDTDGNVYFVWSASKFLIKKSSSSEITGFFESYTEFAYQLKPAILSDNKKELAYQMQYIIVQKELEPLIYGDQTKLPAIIPTLKNDRNRILGINHYFRKIMNHDNCFDEFKTILDVNADLNKKGELNQNIFLLLKETFANLSDEFKQNQTKNPMNDLHQKITIFFSDCQKLLQQIETKKAVSRDINKILLHLFKVAKEIQILAAQPDVSEKIIEDLFANEKSNIHNNFNQFLSGAPDVSLEISKIREHFFWLIDAESKPLSEKLPQESIQPTINLKQEVLNIFEKEIALNNTLQSNLNRIQSKINLESADREEIKKSFGDLDDDENMFQFILTLKSSITKWEGDTNEKINFIKQIEDLERFKMFNEKAKHFLEEMKEKILNKPWQLSGLQMKDNKSLIGFVIDDPRFKEKEFPTRVLEQLKEIYEAEKDGEYYLHMQKFLEIGRKDDSLFTKQTTKDYFRMFHQDEKGRKPAKLKDAEEIRQKFVVK